MKSPRRRNHAYLFSFFNLFLLGVVPCANGQQSGSQKTNSHTIRIYRSKDSLVQNDVGTSSGSNHPDSAALRQLKRLILSSSDFPKGETRQSVVTGSLILRVASTGTTCGESNGSIDVVASGGTPPYTYSENGYPQQSVGYFWDLAPGIYQVTAKDATGATTTTTVILSNTFEPPTVEVVGYTFLSSCSSSDGSITLQGYGGKPPYMYGDGYSNFQSSNTISNLPAVYYLYGLFVKDANGCINSYFGGFDYGNPGGCKISSQITGYNASCIKEGTIEVFDVTGGTAPYQYSLDGIHYQESPDFTNLPSGQYDVYIKDATGFVEMRRTFIGQYCSITVTVTADSPPCGESGGSFSVDASFGTPPYQYSIDGANYQTSNVFTGLPAGRYTVSVRDANGAFSTVNSAIDNSCLLASSTETDEGCGQKNGSITAIADNGEPPYRYSIDGVNFQSGNLFSNLASGQYTITVADASGKSATTLATVNSSCLTVGLSYTGTTCGKNNGSITTTVSNGTAPYQYSIDGVNFQAGNIFTNLSAGDYTVSAKDAVDLLSTAEITVTDQPGPSLSPIFTQASCHNTNGSISLVRYGGTGPVLYSIDDGASLHVDSVFKSLDSGQYFCYAKDANGCVVRQTLHLTALPKPSVALGDDTTLCDGQTLQLNAASDNATYLWQDGSTTPTFTVSAGGIYSVKISENGCDTTAKIDVSVISKPVISGIDDTTICTTQQIILDASYPNSTYEWQDGSTNAQFTVSKEGRYMVEVTNRCGSATASSTVTFKNCACKFYIPNVFTPNGDGKNDVFTPKSECQYSHYEMKIYNRWGQLVFVSETPSNGWDGTMGGYPQPTGSYVWEIAYQDILTGKFTRKNGTLVLIR